MDEKEETKTVIVTEHSIWGPLAAGMAGYLTFFVCARFNQIDARLDALEKTSDAFRHEQRTCRNPEEAAEDTRHEPVGNPPGDGERNAGGEGATAGEEGAAPAGESRAHEDPAFFAGKQSPVPVNEAVPDEAEAAHDIAPAKEGFAIGCRRSFENGDFPHGNSIANRGAQAPRETTSSPSTGKGKVIPGTDTRHPAPKAHLFRHCQAPSGRVGWQGGKTPGGGTDRD